MTKSSSGTTTLIAAGALAAFCQFAPLAANAAPPPDLAEPLQACVGCHGEDGNGAKRTYPSLNWQLPKYLEDQMVGFQEGTQPTNVPKHIPKTLTREQIKGIARYYGTQKAEREKPAFDAAKASAGKTLFEARCIECHLDNGRASNQDEPTLAGQPAEYLLTQEKWYASGKRKYSMKADVAHKGMSDADREAVSHFLASQDIKPAETTGKKRRRQ
jgi:cytochrome c553